MNNQFQHKHVTQGVCAEYINLFHLSLCMVEMKMMKDSKNE